MTVTEVKKITHIFKTAKEYKKWYEDNLKILSPASKSYIKFKLYSLGDRSFIDPHNDLKPLNGQLF